MITVQDAFALVQYTAEENRALDKLENRIDAELASRFDGAPIRLVFPGDEFSPKFVAAIQRRYEERGGWRVVTDIKANAFSFIPMHLPPAPGMKARAGKVDLPRINTNQIIMVPYDGFRLLVRMPTRGRARQALEVLAKYRAMAGMPILVEVVIDEDDASMVCAEVLQRLRALDCIITVGQHASKVEAVNGGRRDLEWDALMLASDDMVPVGDMYAVTVRDRMRERFPLLDGCIYFDDGYQHEKIVTLPIMGRRLYDRFGYVYHPDYKSLWCDQEQTDVLAAMGRLAYVDEVIIEHHHHVTGLSKVDATYKRNDALWEEDKATYERRREVRFEELEPLLSILICTLPMRGDMLARLVDELYHQMRDGGWDDRVEVLVDSSTNTNVGTKRQILLERARGQYICFVDDDDWVAHDYVQRICEAVYNNSGVDCVTLNGVMTTAGAVPEPFYNSIANPEWYSKDGAHYRTPTHLSPVKRELALKAGFQSMSYGEDHDFSKRLRPLLKREESAGNAPLYFYFYFPKSDKKEG